MEKIFELLVEDETDFISAISLVEMPAIEEPFLYFNNEEIKFSKIETEKRMLIGPVLIPEKHILRLEADGTPYKVYFSKKTVAKLAQNYLKNKLTDSATLEHGDKKIKGVHLVESWIKESKLDKANSYGMGSLPEGTWMGMFYIDETPDGERIWNDYIKTGKVKGFSVEALVTHKLIKASQHYLDKDINDLNEEEANIFLGQIKAIIKKDKRFKKKERIEFETYNDYGQSIRNNAKKGIELNEKNGNKCATQTGKVRAQQIAKGENLSVETIKRMHSYLSRAETYYDETDMNACGTISYLLWGGKAALSWSRNKLRELGLLEEAEANPQVTSSYPGEVASGSVAPALK
jgi:hypothetical protein